MKKFFGARKYNAPQRFNSTNAREPHTSKAYRGHQAYNNGSLLTGDDLGEEEPTAIKWFNKRAPQSSDLTILVSQR